MKRKTLATLSLMGVAALSFFTGITTKEYLESLQQERVRSHQTLLSEIQKISPSFLESFPHMREGNKISCGNIDIKRLTREQFEVIPKKETNNIGGNISLEEITDILDSRATGEQPRKPVQIFPPSKFTAITQSIKDRVRGFIPNLSMIKK